MDDYTRTTQHITTEEVVPEEPVVPVTPVAPVYTAPAAPVAPVYTAPAAPVYAAPAAAPVVARPAAASRVITDHQVVHEGPTALEMTRRIVGLAFGILQSLIVLRIILLLLVANRDNDIVRFILGVTDPFVNPFRDMFALDRIGASGSVLDIAAIVAIIGWTLVEVLIFAIINLGARRRTVVY
jgi:uncharacterized protein YggT (Ycf19 family)